MRLIDADAMRQSWLENGYNEYVYDTNAVLYSIDDQPTIDAVEVVRCKECIHQRNTDGFYACHKFMGNNVSIITSPNNYCCCGKRKEEV